MQNMLIDAVNLNNNLFLNELKEINIHNYSYTPDEAIEELGLELEEINHLIDDYVIQIVTSNMAFLQYLHELQSSKDNHKIMNFTPLQELAHKNLGVARNLRIHDAQKLLYTIMKEEDLEHIFLCLEGLFACVTILRPQKAFDTLRLIKVKNSL
ncbi:hypothetical protein [Sulfurimonas sp.]|uniref:hypothetical protein n=1 Tax=Sulfurimonas sp. TaxID=2022749 RepID=UPI0039E2C401